MIHSLVIDLLFLFFFFNDTATTEIYTLSLHDALPISSCLAGSHLWYSTLIPSGVLSFWISAILHYGAVNRYTVGRKRVSGPTLLPDPNEIGRASCRERV